MKLISRKYWLVLGAIVITMISGVAVAISKSTQEDRQVPIASKEVISTPTPATVVPPSVTAVATLPPAAPKQKPLPPGIDPRSVAEAKKHGWSIDASKKHKLVRVLHYNPATMQVSVTLSVGSSYGKYWPDCDTRTSCLTPDGVWAIHRKEGENYRSKSWPKPNGGARMPWATFFHGGAAFHYGDSSPSHGCVHIVKRSAAKYIHDLPMGTKVIVHQ